MSEVDGMFIITSILYSKQITFEVLLTCYSGNLLGIISTKKQHMSILCLTTWINNCLDLKSWHRK